MLSDGGIRDDQADKIWQLCIPLKVKIFCWLVLKKSHLTTDNLLKRGWTWNIACVLCGVEEETVDHFFTSCVFIRFFIVSTVDNRQPDNLGDDVLFVWGRWMEQKENRSHRPRLARLAACWLFPWKVRNDVIFRKAHANPRAAIHSINLWTKLWDFSPPAIRRRS